MDASPEKKTRIQKQMHDSKKNPEIEKTIKSELVQRQASSMIIAAFAELNAFNLRHSLPPGHENYMAAKNLVFNDQLWYKTMHDFLRGLLAHCNMADEPQLPKPCHIQALPRYNNRSLQESKTPYVVDVNNLIESFIVVQYGARAYQDIGPAPETGVEERLMNASLAFTTAVREVLEQCGVTELSVFKSMTKELADRVRFLVVETNEARKAYLNEDAKNYYATVARTLDTLYKKAHNPAATSVYRADMASRLAGYRALVRSADLMRYDAEFASRVSNVMHYDEQAATTATGSEPLHVQASPMGDAQE
jgi:hypothetical protein